MTTDVLVDGKALGDASAYRGIGTYLRNLLHHLATVQDVRLTVMTSGEVALPAGVRRARTHRLAPGRWAEREHDLLLPVDLALRRPAVFHSPALDPPRWCPSPWIYTLHDVIPLIVDDPAFAPRVPRWQKMTTRLRRADAIIAISRDCADKGITELGLDPRRVHVVYHGVQSSFRPPTSRETTDNPYLLYVGEFDHRKGYSEAMAVAAAVAEAGQPHILKIAGRLAPWVRPEVDALVRASARPDRIELLGYVDHDSDLPGLYQGASVMVVSSRHEGFGLPTVEAMATGLPVVAFANTATREIVGTGGDLIEDGDVVAFSAAVIALLTAPSQWEDASARAIERARMFNWERCAADTAAIYRAVGSL